MQPPEAVEVRLSDVCRSCLIKSTTMTNFSEKTDQTSEIIAMLSSVGNFEIEINEFLPCYLCKPCEEKLRLSYEFQMLIQRSNEIIRECMSGIDLFAGMEEKCEEIKVESEPIVVNPVVRGSKKLKEFSPSEVEEAIKEYRNKFFVNTECIKCNFITSNSRALSVHMSHAHKDLKDRWCSVCNREVDNLREHLNQHAEDHFKCKFCGKKFTMAGHFYEHLRTHSSVKPHTCHICHRGFLTQRHLDRHIRVHLNNRYFKCSHCPANFALRNALKDHLKSHYISKKPLEIPESDETTLQNFCNICNKRVRSLEQHLQKIHDPNNPNEAKKKEGILCTLCGKKFNSLNRFRLHMRTHTGETPYKCSYCDRRMTNKNHLVIHERTHTGEKPYMCNICGRGFSQNSVLNTHMKIHTGRPVVCEICSKRFCRNAQLRLHMRKHTGEKPYQCSECDQAFKQQSHLSEHLRRHSDERPYRCSVCDKSFKQMSILKSHLTIHTGEKPFKCSQCPYASRQSHSLTQHMRQHSADAPNPDKPHFCTLCQKGYTTMAMLMSHNDLAHGNLKLLQVGNTDQNKTSLLLN